MLFIALFLINNIKFHSFIKGEYTNSSLDSDSIVFNWITPFKGLNYTEFSSPKQSIQGDNKIKIVQIDPVFFEFHLISATEKNELENVDYWIENQDFNLIFNAGMYKLKDEHIHRFYMRNFEHYNNPKLTYNVNSIIAFNPKYSDLPSFTIFDLQYDDWSLVESNYNTIVQGIRMLDCNGDPVYWKSDNQQCSMLVAAMDKIGNFYLIFSRSPFSQNTMIDILKLIPIDLINAVYIEGGSRANFYLNVSDFKIKEVGSYVSNYNENDLNKIFYPFPNFIGLKIKD